MTFSKWVEPSKPEFLLDKKQMAIRCPDSQKSHYFDWSAEFDIKFYPWLPYDHGCDTEQHNQLHMRLGNRDVLPDAQNHNFYFQGNDVFHNLANLWSNLLPKSID